MTKREDSLYDALEVPRDADVATIKSAWRRKRGKAHPDKGGDPAQFRALQRAYEVLSDPDKRERYDRTGTIEEQAPDPDAAAKSLMTQMLLAALEKPDPVAEAVAAVEGGLNAMRQQLIAMHSGVHKCKAALKRLTRGELHRSIIEGAIADIERRVEAAEREIAVGLRCIELLKEGEFEKPVGYASVQGYYAPSTATMYTTGY